MSVENGGKVLREIFKAIMIAQFVTPSESHLREKPFSRNAEQVRSPSLISFLLGGCRGIHTCVFDIGALSFGLVGVVRCLCMGVVRCVRTSVVWIWAYDFSDMGGLHFCYRRTKLHVHTYV